ncbi:MAG: adenylate/guanylate cyclase domain-containing protein [Desulfobacula sp.]|jgi:adenylate cyclase|nr:adenylate/guanylate cyclase domain-containing protein [Desulfobacula sp.]
MEGRKTKRKLAAIFSADVKDYTRLMQEDEPATVVTITSYRDLMSTLILQHHGRVVDSPGDNVLAEFSSVVDAVQGAVSIQKELKARNAELPDRRKMEFRIGINLGDVIIEGDRIYGDGVNIAARLEALSDPGGICISRTAFDQIEDKLPLGYEYMGEQFAKNIQKPLRVYKVNIWSKKTITKKNKLFSVGKKSLHQKYFKFPRRHKKTTEELQAAETKKRKKSKRRFKLHLNAYLGIIGFLLIINILTFGHGIWFYWPALCWGVVLFLHWLIFSFSYHSKD